MSENQWGLGGMEIEVKEQEDYLMAWVHNIPCLCISACVCARAHALAHPRSMSVTVLVCVSHSTDVKAGGQLFHHVGSKAGDKHHYLLGYFRSPETRSVTEPGVHSLATLADR